MLLLQLKSLGGLPDSQNLGGGRMGVGTSLWSSRGNNRFSEGDMPSDVVGAWGIPTHQFYINQRAAECAYGTTCGQK